MDRFGSGAFPSPAVLAAANPAEIGLPGRRGEAIRRLAAAVEAGSLQLDECVDSGDTAGEVAQPAGHRGLDGVLYRVARRQGPQCGFRKATGGC